MANAARSLPWLAVLLLALSVGALYRRQSALADRLDLLERRPSPAATGRLRPAGRADEAPASADPAPPSAPERPPSARAAEAPAGPGARGTAPAEALTPAQREAVAREVDRVLRERGPAVMAVNATADPVTLLERELGLSPAQKLRVGELWKQREEELAKLAGEGFREGPTEHLRRMKAAEDRWDDAIKRELDFAQQQSYDRLRREGRLPLGIVIRIDASEK